MAVQRTVSAAARRIVDLVRAHKAGITEQDLLPEATREFRVLPRQRPARLLTEAIDGGLLIASDDGLFRAVPQHAEDCGQPPAGGTRTPGTYLPRDPQELDCDATRLRMGPVLHTTLGVLDADR